MAREPQGEHRLRQSHRQGHRRGLRRHASAGGHRRGAYGIDLIDWENRVAVQVSVTCAPKTIREKIRNSIRKFDKPEGDWQFYFVPITDKAQDLQKDFELPDGLIFDKDRDVLDITRIMELADAAASAKKRALSALVDRYSKDETDYLELRKKLDDLLLLTWKAHRSYKLMQTDEIDQRLFPNIKDPLLPGGVAPPFADVFRSTVDTDRSSWCQFQSVLPFVARERYRHNPTTNHSFTPDS